MSNPCEDPGPTNKNLLLPHTRSTLENDNAHESAQSKTSLDTPPILYGKALPSFSERSSGSSGGPTGRHYPTRTCGIKYLITSTFPPFEHTRSGGVFQDLLDTMNSKDPTVPTEPTYYSTTPYSSTTGIDYSLASRSPPKDGETGAHVYKELPLEYYYHTTGARSLPKFDKSFYNQKKHPRMSILTSQFPPFESAKYFSVPPPKDVNAPENFQLFDVTGARDLPYPPKQKTAPLRVRPPHEATALQPTTQTLDFTTRSVSRDTRRSLGETVRDIRAGETRSRLAETLYTNVKPEDFLIGTSTRYHGTFKYPQ